MHSINIFILCFEIKGQKGGVMGIPMDNSITFLKPLAGVKPLWLCLGEDFTDTEQCISTKSEELCLIFLHCAIERHCKETLIRHIELFNTNNKYDKVIQRLHEITLDDIYIGGTSYNFKNYWELFVRENNIKKAH